MGFDCSNIGMELHKFCVSIGHAHYICIKIILVLIILIIYSIHLNHYNNHYFQLKSFYFRLWENMHGKLLRIVKILICHTNLKIYCFFNIGKIMTRTFYHDCYWFQGLQFLLLKIKGEGNSKVQNLLLLPGFFLLQDVILFIWKKIFITLQSFHPTKTTSWSMMNMTYDECELFNAVIKKLCCGNKKEVWNIKY